ncbi:MAG: SLC13 family permease [Candidatus Merdivicinus sp.]
MKEKLLRFVKAEPVLVVSGLLALASMAVVPPSAAYFSYVDFRTLGILFCLMAAVAGLTEAGLFGAAAAFLVRRGGSQKSLCLLLVLLCFTASMLITNDVALITFVPLTLLLLNSAEERCRIFTVVMETIAANLGSMLTPVGNPQNLYLFSHYEINLGEFFSVTAPVWGMGLILTAGTVLLGKLPGKVSLSGVKAETFNGKKALFYGGMFLLSLLAVFRFLHWEAVLAVTVTLLLIFNQKLFRKIDYSLLLTFLFFFLLVGNLGSIPEVQRTLSGILAGREVLISAAVSQVISNVPAALMLAGFSEDWRGLLVGTNIGGLGTLIASMASLISFRLYSRGENARTGRYLAVFSVYNLLFLILLFGIFFRM